ncbi:MAG: response regulator transcription factor [Humibacillus sp.]|nr:response regulator transcription factor [Humibacillus sp.]MDN5776144.1 response regulator transcription factor [Humibacillus sp.]
MTTTTLLAWSHDAPEPTPTVCARVEEHGGRFPHRPGLALFTGTADAVAAAIVWQQAEQDQPATSLALHVAELTYRADAPEPASVGLVRELAGRGHPGDILATEIVRMLLPTPTPAHWSDELATSIGEPAQLVHALRWPRNVDAAPITVVVAEDVALIRAGLLSLLRDDGFGVVGEAGDYDSVLATVRATRPRLLITDVRMPPEQGDEGLRAASLLRTEQPGLAVLVLSQSVQAGAAADLLTEQTSGLGYLLKERVTALDEFLDAARAVAAGRTVIDPLITDELLARHRNRDQLAALAERERSVLELMAQGLSNGAIADRLTLSARTVESHVRSIMTKLDLWEDPAGNRRVQAVIRWLDQS